MPNFFHAPERVRFQALMRSAKAKQCCHLEEREGAVRIVAVACIRANIVLTHQRVSQALCLEHLCAKFAESEQHSPSSPLHTPSHCTLRFQGRYVRANLQHWIRQETQSQKLRIQVKLITASGEIP